MLYVSPPIIPCELFLSGSLFQPRNESELPQKRPPRLLILYNILQPARRRVPNARRPQRNSAFGAPDRRGNRVCDPN